MRTALKQPSTQGGFALVLALTLMSLLLLLALSLTVLVRIESSATTTATQQLKARTNAMLAMNVALGSLQKQAGVDQVVIAGADQGGIPIDGRSHWSGVWRDGSANGASDPEVLPDDPILLNWLTSGNEATGPSAGNGPEPIYSPWGANGEETIVLVGANPTEPDGVQAPLVEIDNEDGRYAWWIGDENRKARLALEDFDPQPGESPVLTFAVAQSSAGIIHFPELNPMAPVPNPDLIRSSATAAIASGIEPEVLQEYFHDVTFVSESLLTNTRDGGLRMDLTTAFRDDGEFDSLRSRHGDQIFPQLSGDALDPGGPQWEQLRSFSRLHLELSGSGDSTRAGLIEPSRVQHGIAPVLTRASVWFGLAASEHSGDTGEQIRLLILPSFTLWNPYNVELELPALYLRFARYGVPDQDTRRGMTLAVHEQGYDNPQAPTDLLLGDFPDGQAFDFRLPAVVLPPGETRVFSVSDHLPFDPDNADNNVLDAGWYPGMAFYVDTDVEYDRDDEPGKTLQVWGGNSPYGWFLSTNEPGPNFDAILQVTDVHGQQNALGFQDYDELMEASAGPYPVDSAAAIGSGITTVLRFPENSIQPFTQGQPHSLQWLGNNNPRAPHFSRFSVERVTAQVDGIRNPVSYISRLLNDKSSYNFDSLGDSGYIGYSDTASGLTQATLFDLPRSEDEILSIGQFMHANLGNAPEEAAFAPGFGNNRVFYTESYRPAYVIGNDSPHFAIPGTELFYIATNSLQQGNSGFSITYDYPWLVNHTLWDSFYLSSLPSTWNDASIASNESLPSRRIRLRNQDIGISDLRQSDSSAQHFVVEGGFNINSTSEVAWELFLGALSGEPPLRLNDTRIVLEDPEAVSYARSLRSATDGFTDTDNRFAESAYNGFRELAAEELRALAESIVAELIERRGDLGPFTSKAEFINRSRRSDAPAEQLYSGLLQRAIDRSGINDAFRQNNSMIRGSTLAPDGVIDANNQAIFPDDLDTQSGSVYKGLPGYLTQMDLLARLGHLMAVRSDTFTIRIMGESGDPDLSPNRAYLEAVVRRTAEFVDPFANPGSPDTPEKDLSELHPINQNFGRKFEVVAIRWLAPEEL